MNVLDLFSGIGGFSLGLERAGMRTVAFCEVNPFCRQVLAEHWPTVPCYDDVRSLTAERLKADGITADVICGGFPCQDISQAGKRAGITGERSGLWSEYARLIGEIRPRFVIVENVAALLNRGMDVVLRDLAALGFDAEWHCIPASAVGAPHRRDRVWIVAHAKQRESLQRPEPDMLRRREDEAEQAGVGRSLVADAERGRLPARHEQYDSGDPIFFTARSCQSGRHHVGQTWWPEPRLDRVAYGLPDQMERCVALGNAVVPQIPEIIGRAILAASAVD